MTGLLVLGAAVVVALLTGVLLRVRAGRIRERSASTLPAAVLAVRDPAAAVTLVLLTTEFCAQCQHTRVLLADLVEHTEGLAHTEVDLTDQPELARELAVLRTPTTLAVDASGTELLRVGGLPRRTELLDALRPHLPSH